MIIWNTPQRPAASLCLHELVEQSAMRYPERLTIDGCDKQLTYKELNDEAGDLAMRLQVEYEIVAEDLVLLYYEKSSSMIIAILAVLKAGAGFVPLDSSHPGHPLKHIVREIGAKVIITSPMQLHKFTSVDSIPIISFYVNSAPQH